jgi:hypothetical protein
MELGKLGRLRLGSFWIDGAGPPNAGSDPFQ